MLFSLILNHKIYEANNEKAAFEYHINNGLRHSNDFGWLFAKYTKMGTGLIRFWPSLFPECKLVVEGIFAFISPSSPMLGWNAWPQASGVVPESLLALLDEHLVLGPCFSKCSMLHGCQLRNAYLMIKTSVNTPAAQMHRLIPLTYWRPFLLVNSHCWAFFGAVLGSRLHLLESEHHATVLASPPKLVLLTSTSCTLDKEIQTHGSL